MPKSSVPRKATPISGQETASKWIVLGIVAIGVFMATLDASIVNISLPRISLYFQAHLSGMVEWVIIAYLIVVAGSLLTLGRLSDMIGRRAMWVKGLAFFTAGSPIVSDHGCSTRSDWLLPRWDFFSSAGSHNRCRFLT